MLTRALKTFFCRSHRSAPSYYHIGKADTYVRRRSSLNARREALAGSEGVARSSVASGHSIVGSPDEVEFEGIADGSGHGVGGEG